MNKFSITLSSFSVCSLHFVFLQVFILEELLSPVVTPIILIFCLRRKSLEIIDFFRNFTVEVIGVGDTCSFAQMDIRQHGHPAVRDCHNAANFMTKYVDVNTKCLCINYVVLLIDNQSSLCSGCQRGRQRHLSISRQRMGRRSYR